MLFSIGLLLVIAYLAWRAAPREQEQDLQVHGAGQVGMLAALALFGVDYFTSYYYATGEMMHALHPYNLQGYAYIAVSVIAFANIAFGILYMYALGIFNEGGGSFTAAMRYLGPSISLVVAVVLIQDYVFTIVVSTLSGADQLLSLWNAQASNWWWNFGIAAALATMTWFLTIRGRGESAQVVFTMLGIFALTTITMFIGLMIAQSNGVGAAPEFEEVRNVSLGQAAYHMLVASMKGLVALTGLEAMSNGIQFVIDEDAGFVKWGKRRFPKWRALWAFYSGKAGIGRFVQTSFLFYGGLTSLILTIFAIHFNVFDGTYGRTLVGNLAFIGFGQFPGGEILFWAYQILAVILLGAASMTAYQDLQSMAWRNVAIGEIPEVVVYRNPKGTFTRPVTAAFIAAILIQFLLQARTSAAVPFYGVGVFLPITAMGLAIRKHVYTHYTGRKRKWGGAAATFATALGATIFLGQIVGKWEEGGWVVLISLAVLILIAHAILISPVGYRTPQDIHRIVREKSRIQGTMGNIAEWQSLLVQEYRYRLLVGIARFAEMFGVRRPERFEPPIAAGTFEEALDAGHHHRPSLIEEYLAAQPKQTPRLGGAPRESGLTDNDTQEE